MTIFRIERLSPIETQKHCISNSLKYNASLHFLYRHVDIITLLSCTLSESDCIYQKRSQQFIHALLTSYNTTHFIYFAASQTIFLFLNITSVFPPSLYIPPDSNREQVEYIDKYYIDKPDDIKLDKKMKSIFDRISEFRKKKATKKCDAEEDARYGLLFLLAIFFAPIFTAIPGFATAPALIFVGFLMVSAIVKVDFEDLTDAVPAYLCLIAMPLMYSIAEGIAIGVISFVLINLICGKRKKITPLMYILAVLFICKYIFL